MGVVYRDRLAALADTWRVWAETGAGLTGDDWSRPARCAGWDVAALYAHHSVMPEQLSTGIPDIDGGPRHSNPQGDLVTAPEVIRRFNAPGGVAHTMADTVASMAVAEAGQRAPDELVHRFRVRGPEAVRLLAELGSDRVVPWSTTGMVVTMTEGLRIVLMEATVHLLDVQRALGRTPDVPPRALTETVRLLAETAPAVDLIEAATGRSDHSPLPVLR